MLVWLALLISIGAWTEANADQPAWAEGPREVRAEELLAAYQFNQARVDTYFQDRPVIIEGPAMGIHRMGEGTVDGYDLLMLLNPNHRPHPELIYCRFPPSARQSLADIKTPEQRVRVVGICRGRPPREQRPSENTLLIEHCELLPLRSPVPVTSTRPYDPFLSD